MVHDPGEPSVEDVGVGEALSLPVGQAMHGDVDVAGFSRQVLRCLAAADGIVECRTAVTGTDDDGLTGMVAQGLENVLAQCL